MPMTREQITQKLNQFVTLWHASNLDGIMAMFAEDATVEHPNGLLGKGRAEIRSHCEPYFSGELAAGRFVIERMDIDVDTQTAWSTWKFSFKKDGQSFTIPGAEMFVFNSKGLIQTQAAYGKSNDLA